MRKYYLTYLYYLCDYYFILEIIISLVMKNMDWNTLAAGIIKAELKRRNISYENLITMLEKIGVKETQSSILNKMSRGTFQFSFFLQCAAAIGLKNLRLEDITLDHE